MPRKDLPCPQYEKPNQAFEFIIHSASLPSENSTSALCHSLYSTSGKTDRLVPWEDINVCRDFYELSQRRPCRT